MKEKFIKVKKEWLGKYSLPEIVIISLIRDRMEFSKKTLGKYTDKNGKPFAIYTNKDLCKMAKCSKTTCSNTIRKFENLKILGVFRKVKKANRYYYRGSINNPLESYYKLYYKHLNEFTSLYVIFILMLIENKTYFSIVKDSLKDENGYYCIFKRKDFCDKLNCSKDTVKRALNELEDKKYIFRKRQYHGGTKIYLTFGEIDLIRPDIPEIKLPKTLDNSN